MLKVEQRVMSDNAISQFLKNGGVIQRIKSKKNPKQITAGSGSTKHCGRTNSFGQRI